MKSITMIGDKILVCMKPRRTHSEGGIVLPEFSQTTEQWGTVKAVGPKVRNVTVEDEVFIELHVGTHLRVDGVDYLIIEEPKLKLIKPCPPQTADTEAADHTGLRQSNTRLAV